MVFPWKGGQVHFDMKRDQEERVNRFLLSIIRTEESPELSLRLEDPIWDLGVGTLDGEEIRRPVGACSLERCRKGMSELSYLRVPTLTTTVTSTFLCYSYFPKTSFFTYKQSVMVIRDVLSFSVSTVPLLPPLYITEEVPGCVCTGKVRQTSPNIVP